MTRTEGNLGVCDLRSGSVARMRLLVGRGAPAVLTLVDEGVGFGFGVVGDERSEAAGVGAIALEVDEERSRFSVDGADSAADVDLGVWGRGGGCMGSWDVEGVRVAVGAAAAAGALPRDECDRLRVAEGGATFELPD